MGTILMQESAVLETEVNNIHWRDAGCPAWSRIAPFKLKYYAVLCFPINPSIKKEAMAYMGRPHPNKVKTNS